MYDIVVKFGKFKSRNAFNAFYIMYMSVYFCFSGVSFGMVNSVW